MALRPGVRLPGLAALLLAIALSCARLRLRGFLAKRGIGDDDVTRHRAMNDG